MRIDGTLKTWNDERGFGFIEPLHGGQEIFVHVKAFEGRLGRPQVGQRLSFEVELGPSGKKRARRVQTERRARPSTRRQAGSPAQWGTASYFAIPGFALIYLIAALLWHVPKWVGGFYLGASAVAFMMYWNDKRAAEAGRWRTPENTLLLWGLAGGWPGAIVAHQILRHKSIKGSFRVRFWATVAVNIVAFVGLAAFFFRHPPA